MSEIVPNFSVLISLLRRATLFVAFQHHVSYRSKSLTLTFGYQHTLVMRSSYGCRQQQNHLP